MSVGESVFCLSSSTASASTASTDRGECSRSRCAAALSLSSSDSPEADVTQKASAARLMAPMQRNMARQPPRVPSSNRPPTRGDTAAASVAKVLDTPEKEPVCCAVWSRKLDLKPHTCTELAILARMSQLVAAATEPHHAKPAIDSAKAAKAPPETIRRTVVRAAGLRRMARSAKGAKANLPTASKIWPTKMCWPAATSDTLKVST
mmetsp:Transcript_24063/g.72206  ORF Transcript_24063/g.72206 Transcript_24063/m.72206 type:complete len:206 (-) Transcript_24063:3-620(-)